MRMTAGRNLFKAFSNCSSLSATPRRRNTRSTNSAQEEKQDYQQLGRLGRNACYTSTVYWTAIPEQSIGLLYQHSLVDCYTSTNTHHTKSCTCTSIYKLRPDLYHMVNLLLGIRRVRSTMPRAHNRPCKKKKYSLSTRLQNPIFPRQLNLERGRVSKARKSTRMARLSVLLICRTFEALLTSVMTA